MRNAILKAVIALIKRLGKTINAVSIDLADHILSQTAKCGEKYDINLELLSELCLQISSLDLPIANSESISKSTVTLIDILKEKGGDSLIKNIDLIRKNLAL